MKYQVTINGQMFDVTVEVAKETAGAKRPANTEPIVLPVAPASSEVTTQDETVNSPMPGNVWELKVAIGDQVVAGQTLLILEAMKMENEIVAPRDGIVKQVLVTKGTIVEANQVLIVIS